MSATVITAGRPYPMGATPEEGGVNFALAAEAADAVELCLFDDAGTETRLVLPGRSGSVRHGFVRGIGAGQRYGYRVHGTSRPERGLLFNPNKLLSDPYTRRTDGLPQYRNAAELARFSPHDPHDNAPFAPKCVVAAPSSFDWEDDRRPDIPWAHTVIYEAHAKGLTRLMPGLPDAGSYAALGSRQLVGHLQSLGITALQLLPLQLHADEYRLQSSGRSNYWGYNPYACFAVETRYARQPENAEDELRGAVKALHAAGIEVILDMVFNHTAEEDAQGPMLGMRGISQPMWYALDQNGQPLNHSGCGNTLNTARFETAQWVADCLRYWAQEFHIDGFRFDLAAILGRNPGFSAGAAMLQILRQDPLIGRLKLIAEPWDLGADGYCAGAFPAPFAEWNDRFRDSVRAFWLHESGRIDLLADCLSGSASRYRPGGRPAAASVNFITAHDGFTLHDLTSYRHKHNLANGENNADGSSRNTSHNHGCEGPTGNPDILAARKRSRRALLATLLLSSGTPMLAAGDEFGNSQSGNNNAYCQDNPTGWLDWLSFDEELAAYVRKLAALRREIPLIGRQGAWWDGRAEWFAADGRPMDETLWHDTRAKTLQVLLDGRWLLLANGSRRPQTFALPPGRWLDRLPPDDGPGAVFSGSLNADNLCLRILKKAA